MHCEYDLCNMVYCTGIQANVVVHSKDNACIVSLYMYNVIKISRMYLCICKYTTYEWNEKKTQNIEWGDNDHELLQKSNENVIVIYY